MELSSYVFQIYSPYYSWVLPSNSFLEFWGSVLATRPFHRHKIDFSNFSILIIGLIFSFRPLTKLDMKYSLSKLGFLISIKGLSSSNFYWYSFSFPNCWSLLNFSTTSRHILSSNPLPSNPLNSPHDNFGFPSLIPQNYLSDFPSKNNSTTSNF